MRPLQAVALPLLLVLVLAAPAAADGPGPGEGAGARAGQSAATPDDEQTTTDDASTTRDARAPMRGWSAPLRGGRITAAYRVPGPWWAAGYHTGVDLAVPEGTPVRSVGPGTVIEAGWHAAYGNYVKVRMNDGHYILYGHLSRLRTWLWDRVGGGELIGLSGSTGNATGPHLHFEVRTQRGYGSDIDPLRYLAQHRVRL